MSRLILFYISNKNQKYFYKLPILNKLSCLKPFNNTHNTHNRSSRKIGNRIQRYPLSQCYRN